MSSVSSLAWGGTVAAIAALIGVDLLAFRRRSKAVSTKEATAWSAFYIALALAFGLVLGLVAGSSLATQYLAAYLVEKSLSVDNLFVFVVIISTFAVPPEHQPKALTIGIVGALLLRLMLIVLGAALIDAFSAVFLLFGVALIATALQLFRHRDEDPSIDDNIVVSLTRRLLPVSDRYDGGRLWTRRGGKRALTPMFLVIAAIGSTDMLFALDSIPAAFGVTQHAYVIFAANAFALLGLRALFFLVSGLLDKLVYLSMGLSLILAFIGAKLILHFGHTESGAVPQISTAVSLVVIGVILIAVTAASLLKARRDRTAHAHAGSLRAHRAERDGGAPAGERGEAAGELGGDAGEAGEAGGEPYQHRPRRQ